MYIEKNNIRKVESSLRFKADIYGLANPETMRREKEKMEFKEYCNQYLAGKTGQELAFQITNDILNENGIAVPEIPVFLGEITATLEGKQYINNIRSVFHREVLLKNYPFRMYRTNKMGETVVARPSATVTDEVDADTNTVVCFCVTATTNKKQILLTSSEICISVLKLGLAPNASKEEILERLRERSAFKKLITDYENIIKIQDLALQYGKANDELQKIETDKEKLEIEKENLEKEIESVKNQRDLLIRIGLLEGGNHLQSSFKMIDPFTGSFSELIAHVKSHMASTSKHLIYNDKERIVERFFCAMFTNQLIILSGEPGSGKTSLPVAVAKAMDAECHLISVQPNWTDNQDLLGFYNPIEKRYVSTPFLEALLAAHKDPERIHFICLDEMNLAHIEYYFSGILSAMETEDKKIPLYVGQTVEELTSIICNRYNMEFCQLDESGREAWIAKQNNNSEMSDLVKQWKTANEYPTEISIPSNVVFVGTLNMDETTKGISPKVLDRSYIIEISNYDAGEQRDVPQQCDVHARSITPNEFLRLRKTERHDYSEEASNEISNQQENISGEIKNILREWNDQKGSKDVDGLRKLHLSQRFLLHQLPAMIEPQNPSMSLSDILAGKVLPLMQCDKMPEENRNKIEKAFEEKLGKDDYVTMKFKQMADDNDSISFWWR